MGVNQGWIHIYTFGVSHNFCYNEVESNFYNTSLSEKNFCKFSFNVYVLVFSCCSNSFSHCPSTWGHRISNLVGTSLQHLTWKCSLQMIHVLLSDNCPVGTLNNLGSLTCEDCQAGFYQNMENKLFCYPCPQGTYQNRRGATFCYPCGFGYYQNETNKDFCYSCPSGLSTFTRYASNISECQGKQRWFCKLFHKEVNCVVEQTSFMCFF